ncbi:methyltransferase [Enterovibrio norvegicus]|uniref:methyltransferase n=1 Tax=Enterovibrio norvegicus TaxID=188144 RepID=UPI0013D134DB|nr:methyltransferase [Enterovibrio norvegicus]
MPHPCFSLAERFLALDGALERHRPFWQGMPFDFADLPWRNTYPELCDWLDDQTLASLSTLKASPEQLTAMVKQWLPEAESWLTLCHVKESHHADLYCAPHWSAGIPGRKWSQIAAFNAAMPKANGQHWLEWCAGKGYLGRVLSVSRQSNVTSLEWQETLCRDGQQYAEKHELTMHFVQGDAFAPESQRLVDACDHAVALHACGDLHVTLLKHSVAAEKQSGPSTVTVSPCCYHLIQDKCYQPLSTLAKNSTLSLSKHDLKLPLQETVTAGQTVQNKRYVEVTFRLGFDALQRAITGSAAYLPVPNVQKSLLNEGFEAFCYWAAEQKGIVIPSDTDFAEYHKLGKARFLLVEKMETVRTLFRRPLEMWLVLDRALYLTDNGFDVDVSTFCERALTPRNLLIHATRIQR